MVNYEILPQVLIELLDCSNRVFVILLYQQFSDEEVENMECPWENSLFENTDQLMNERYIAN